MGLIAIFKFQSLETRYEYFVLWISVKKYCNNLRREPIRMKVFKIDVTQKRLFCRDHILFYNLSDILFVVFV